MTRLNTLADPAALAPVYNMGRVYDLGRVDEPADHVGMPVAELTLEPIVMTRSELVAALSLTLGLTSDDLHRLSVDDVGRAVALTVMRQGLDAVQQLAEQDHHDYSDDDVPPAFLADCERRVDELLAGPAANDASTARQPEPVDAADDADGW